MVAQGMIDRGKKSVLGVGISVVDYRGAVAAIMSAARARRAFSVSALAVHGVMTGALDATHRFRLNRLDMVVPDGQPVRWALNLLHGEKLADRVYGPTLMLRLCEAAARDGVPIYLYGSRPEVMQMLRRNLTTQFPELRIAGSSTSRFRQVDDDQNAEIIGDIAATGAGLVFVGLGCPRQEVFAFENADALSCPVVAVGAAFDFHAGTLAQAPRWMQDHGLEWLFRLRHEPRRLWRRYAVLNPLFCWNIALQWVWPDRFRGEDDAAPARRENYV